MTLGTVAVTELQRESRPIFSTQPVTRRKNRKAPHTAIMPFIHKRSLQKGEEEQTHVRGRNSRAVVRPPPHLPLPVRFVYFHSRLPHQFPAWPVDVTKTRVWGGSPGHDPVDAVGVEPVERQREAHHRHDDRDGRDKVAERRRGGRLDADEVCAEVDMSVQDAASSKVTLGGGGC